MMDGGTWFLVLMAVGLLAILWGAAVLFLRRVWFFRDPPREAPRIAGALLSPADGIVVYVRPYSQGAVQVNKLGQSIEVSEITKHPGHLDQEGWIVGVYMSPLDVHFNYAPADAEVEAIVHTPVAINLPMVDLWEYLRLTYLRRAVDLFSAAYRLHNERNTIFFRGQRPDGACLHYAVVEIADKFVNKIDCFVRPGQAVLAGQKLSFIKRGSQVDLIVPRDRITVMVEPGQRVTGALTVLARSE